MKLSQKKTKRLELRISEEDLRLLKVAAYMVGQNPSSLIRMFIDTTINTLRVKVKQGEIKLEDYEAILDDQLQHD